MTKRVYNLKSDPVDMRDHVFARLNPKMDLPNSVDLRTLCSPVVDQGELGSCTANAIASGAMELLQRKYASTLALLSRLDLYYQERLMEGTVNEDAGAIIRDGLKIACSRGVCKEVIWPYNTSAFTQKPPATADTDAPNHKITSYQRLRSIDDVRRCLAEGFPVIMGMPIFESFESNEVATNGTIPMPKWGEKNLGGHAVLVVGYDDRFTKILKRNQGTVTVRNSWGALWGNKGYFTLPMAYITKYVNDLWTVR